MSGQENISGTSIRGFELRRQIGIGGFGSVYNAYQEAVDREVAVKVIHSEYARQIDFIRRFEAEARLIARLEHMNIVPLYDYWRDPSGAYLIMRWLRGGSARAALESHGPWPVTSVVRLLNQISSALFVAHQHGVVHRDIKPENILLDEADNAYLSDFGIAVDMFNDPDEILLENLSFGSPAYMSPEQLTQRVATPLADVYSLGILVYELLTGVNPFPDETTAALMKKQVRDPIPSLSRTRPELPASMDVVIWRATAKTPSARYQDAKLMAAAFQEAASNALAKEKQVPLLNATERETQDYVKTSGLFRNREIDAGGTIDVAGGTLEIGPFGQDQFSTVELSDSAGEPRFSTVEMGDSTLNLDSALSSFAEGTLNLGQDLAARNPYKGLRPFEEFDASDFFGRREVVQLLLDLFEDQRKRFLAVVGPSGSGKSSLVKAGLIPEIRQGGVTGSEQWFIVSMVPGDDPFQELAEALLRVSFDDQPDLHERLRKDPDTLYEVTQDLLPLEDAELLIFIDQFEEVFTVTDDEGDRQRFLQSLVKAVTHPESNIRIVITLRADFYDRPLQYPEFGRLLKDNTEIILPLSASELEETITEPAQRADLILEPGLAKSIVEDVYHQPGALPLLQYALTELYERRNERILEHKAYREIGGVSGALAQRATDIYNKFTKEEKAIARQLFLRLITIEGQGNATRRRQLWNQLLSGISDRKSAEAIINTFAQYRLLTLDRDPVTRSPTVEIAHEALIASWEQLQKWIEENRTDLQRLQRLQTATEEWVNTKRDPSFLARGTRLVEFESLANDTTLALGEDNRTFIESSIELRQRSARRTQMVIAALTIFSVIAIIFAIFALDRQRRAQEAEADAITQAERANSAADISRSRELAATSLSLGQQNDLSLLLSVLAEQTADTFEARSSLLTGLLTTPQIVGHMYGHVGGIRSARYSADGSMIVSGGQNGQIIRWDGENHQMIGEPLTDSTSVINSVDVNANGTLIAAGGDDRIVRLWNAEDGSLLHELEGHEGRIWSVDINPASTLVASGDENGTLIMWDTDSGEVIHRIDNAHDDSIFKVLFSPNGTKLATGSADFSVRLWDVESGEMIGSPMADQHNNWVLALAFSPNGQILVSAGADNVLVLWDSESQAALDRINAAGGWIRDMDFSAAGQYLATANQDGSVELWDLSLSQSLGTLSGHRSGARLWTTAFHPTELRLLTAGDDGVIVNWNIQPPYRPVESVILTNQSTEAIAISSDGKTAITGGAARTVDVWDLSTGQQLRSMEGHEENINSVAISPDGRLVASASTDGTVRVWDLESGEPLYDPLTGHQAEVWDVLFTPDGKEIISAANNGTIIRWDAETGAMINEPISGQPEGVLALALSPDGQLLAAGGRDTTIVLLNRETGEQILPALDRHDEPITAVTFSQDGRTLISAERNDEGTIIMWDVDTGEMQRPPITGPSNWVLDLAVSPDNRFFASAGRDAEVILWDLESGRMLGQPITTAQSWITNWMTSVTFSQDGDKLYTAGHDQFIIEWAVSAEAWITMACRISSRNLSESEWAQYVPDQPYREICDLTQ